jgi:hypothetical protein
MSPISSREYAMKYRWVSARGSAAVADSTKLLRRPNEAENSTRCRSMRRWLLGQRTALQSTAGTFQLLENLSLVTGAHTMNLGMDLRWIRSDSVGAQFARGIFNFNGRFTGSSFADFLLGMTSSRQFSTFQLGNLRERDYMFYLQDDWRVGSRLTMNVGLRYELTSPKFDTQDRMSALDTSAFPDVRVIRAAAHGRSWSDRALVQTDRNNWAPRLGLALQPRPHWTLRAAGGLFYGTPRGAGPALHLLNNWPQSRKVTVPSTSTRSAGQLADGIDQSLLGSATEMPANLSWNIWSQDFTSPTISQWNLSLQRQLAASWVVTTAYVGSSSRHLQRLVNINASDPGNASTERERRMIPSLGAIMMAESSASASYHGLQATVEKRLSHGAQGSLVYTWSHSIDDATELAGAEGILFIQDRRNPRGDRGNSGFDRRHRVVAHALVDLSFGAGRWAPHGGVVGALFKDWQVSSIVTMQSGAPFDVTVLDPANRLGVTPGSSVWRPDLVGGSSNAPPDRRRVDRSGGIRRAAERRRHLPLRQPGAQFSSRTWLLQSRCGPYERSPHRRSSTAAVPLGGVQPY